MSYTFYGTIFEISTIVGDSVEVTAMSSIGVSLVGVSKVWTTDAQSHPVIMPK